MSDGSNWIDRVCDARDAVLASRLFQPSVAIILGSGLGPLADRIEHATSLGYSHIPGFPTTRAVGHAGKLILGYLSGLPVVVMQGRAHRYEGRSCQQVQFPVHVMHALGASTLIATNAAGGLSPRMRIGDLMVIDGHINLLWPLGLGAERAHHPAIRGPAPYDLELLEEALSAARCRNTVLHQGTYLATLGPTYETRSEYRMFRRMGADAVGMSTASEVLAAQSLRMKTLGFSVITNVASTDMPIATSHCEVVDVGQKAGPALMQIIQDLCHNWAGQPD